MRVNSVQRLGGSFRRYLRGTLASTGVSAAVVVLVVAATITLISEITWMVDQRDVLKAASDAGAIAATHEMNRLLDTDPHIDDQDLTDRLAAIVRRYIELNLAHLPEDRQSKAMSSLNIALAVDRVERTLEVSADTDLGGTLLMQHVTVIEDFDESALVESLSGTESFTTPVEVVLAIDISVSMRNRLDAEKLAKPKNGEVSRMNVVKSAARSLVDILGPGAEERVAIGVVPWSNLVRLDAATAARWQDNGWARYATRRQYPVPYKCKNQGTCMPVPIMQDVSATPPDSWFGCLDGQRTGAIDSIASLPDQADLLVPPSDKSYAQSFYRPLEGVAYDCESSPPAGMKHQSCYSDTAVPELSQKRMKDVQDGCWSDGSVNRPVAHWEYPTILPLSTDRSAIEQAIEQIRPMGSRTYSALGALWGQHLLQHSWNDVWGGGNHPVDPDVRYNEGAGKALVLLTDGQDNLCVTQRCEPSTLGINRSVACNAIKNEGTRIYVVAAMAGSFVKPGLEASLRRCSSESGDPNGTYVFLDNPSPESLHAAFAAIAEQLRTTRKVF